MKNGNERDRGRITKDTLLAQLDTGGIPCTQVKVKSGWAIVTPTLGAKVLGAGVDWENAFWTAPALRSGNWLTGGQRTWIAPEMGANSLYFRDAEWVPPETMDPGAYRAQQEADGSHTSTSTHLGASPPEATPVESYECRLTLGSASGKIYTLSLIRTIRLMDIPAPCIGASGISINVSQRLVNRDCAVTANGLGLWSIVQVPNQAPGALIMATHGPFDGTFSRYFGELTSVCVEQAGQNLILRAKQGRRFKIGIPADNSGSYVCSVRRSQTAGKLIVVLKRFTVLRRGHYVDKPNSSPADANGDAIQVYNGPETGDNGFSEIECHSPSSPLLPNGSITHDVDISIWKLPIEDSGSLLRKEISVDLESLRF